MIKKIQIVIIFIIVSKQINAQDTIYINLQSAVDLAVRNNTILPVAKDTRTFQCCFESPSTEIKYRYGQLYTPETGWTLEINQEFDPIINRKGVNNLDRAITNYENSYNLLNRKELEITVKSAYFEWLYFLNLHDHLVTKREYVSKSVSVSQFKYELGETEAVDNLKTIMKASEVETEYTECQYNLDITKNKLKKLLNTRENILLQPQKLEMYMVQKVNDTSAYTGSVITDLVKDRHNVSLAEYELKRMKLFPQFEAGFFYQDITGLNKMFGFQAGIRFNLWNKSIKSTLNKDKVRTDQELEYYNNLLWETEVDIENIILTLDKLFVKIRHYQSHAIPTANMLLNTSIVKYQKEDIEFEEYYNLVKDAMGIKQDYLELLYQYNLTALQLEMYVKK